MNSYSKNCFPQRGFMFVFGAGIGLGDDGGRLVGGEIWIGERSTEDL